jgi:hypothetical protein
VKVKVVIADMVFEAETGGLEAKGTEGLNWFSEETRRREAAVQAALEKWLATAAQCYRDRYAAPPSPLPTPWPSPTWPIGPVYCGTPADLFPAVSSLARASGVVRRLGCPHCGVESQFPVGVLADPGVTALACPNCQKTAHPESWLVVEKP